jgi:hypothetical protein
MLLQAAQSACIYQPQNNNPHIIFPMKAKRIRELAENKEHIPGIYNYCDRWCERCAYTSKCLTFAASEEALPDAASRDLNNAEFWKELEEIFTSTIEMIKEDAKAKGIDLDLTPDPEYKKAKKAQDEKTEQVPCVKSARRYIDIVTVWLEKNKDLIKEKEEALELAASIAIPTMNPEQEHAAIADAFEIVHWYQFQIYVKLKRALSREPGEDPEIDEACKQDSNGSAKVALIGVNRSIGAWASLRNHFPEQADVILDTLVHLERLRRSIEKEFPNAKKFKRQGFDD